MYTLRIMLLFSILAILLVALGSLVGVLLGNFYLWSVIFLIMALAMNVFSYYKSDTMAIRMTGTKLIKESDNPRLFSIVKTVADKAGIPMPKVGIMNTPVQNAFATGRDEKHSVVVATTGILESLDDGELEAVLGHEISHITHRDILVSTIAATIATMIAYIGNMILFSSIFGDRNDNGAGYLMIVAAILIPLGATFVQLGISRTRESAADIGSVELIRKPDKLISSLKKISSPQRVQSRSTSNVGKSAYASLFIVNNFSAHSLLNLFSTHPSLDKRIAVILETKKKLGLE